MARRYPLVDVLIGTPASPTLGGSTLLTHGTVIELFQDKACTTPLAATDPNNGGAAISSVTVDGVSLPPFDATSPDADTGVAYGRPAGATGNGFPIYPLPSKIASDAAAEAAANRKAVAMSIALGGI